MAAAAISAKFIALKFSPGLRLRAQHLFMFIHLEVSSQNRLHGAKEIKT